ncbi:hypothetical protein OAE19_04840, partial [Porticoccaceae bacterium]|nr:hypothetical protein [Porticoccaceae bacterium]
MSNKEEEQLFTLDGTRGKLGQIGEGPVAEPNERFDAGFTPGLENVMASSSARSSGSESPEVILESDDQVPTILSALDDTAISADRALFDDLLSHRIA